MCRAQAARAALLASFPGAQVGLLQLDTSSVTSVLNAAREVKLRWDGNATRNKLFLNTECKNVKCNSSPKD